MRTKKAAVATVCGALLLLLAPPMQADKIDGDAINAAEWQADLPRGRESRPLFAKLQILLGRARFSPGAIDGKNGENTRWALAAFKRHHELDAGDQLDEPTWRKLTEGLGEPVIREYEITPEDVKGPFVERIPEDLQDQAKLDRLSYTSPVELLAEKFHMDEDFLKALNPRAEFGAAGERILVANVKRGRAGKAVRVEVDKSEKAVRAYGKDDQLLAYYPATVGSEAQPAPTGTFKITGAAENPFYTYDPRKLSFLRVRPKKSIKIAPGPNNPVGLAWIGIDKEGYGIHGTPDPSEIGKTSSNGCVRLTNWDALDLARMVRKGVKVEFRD